MRSLKARWQDHFGNGDRWQVSSARSQNSRTQDGWLYIYDFCGITLLYILRARLARPTRRVLTSNMELNWGRKGVRKRFYLVIPVVGRQRVPNLLPTCDLLPPNSKYGPVKSAVQPLCFSPSSCRFYHSLTLDSPGYPLQG
jgi:hypothetical protein